MSVTYKDIDELSQKSSISGTEKLPVSDTEYITPSQIVANDEKFYFVAGSSSHAGNSTSDSYLSTKWEGTVPGVTAPVNGMKIAYRIATNPSVATAGAVLSIDGGTTYYPVVFNVNTSITTRYSIGSTLLMTFNSTQTATAYLTSNTKSTVTGCWQIMDYDSNTNTLVRQYQAGDSAAGTSPKYPLLARYDLTNKYGSYDANYARFHTGATLDTSTGGIEAISFKKTGGTSSQFLKADGSVDSNGYLSLAGGNMDNNAYVSFVDDGYSLSLAYSGVHAEISGSDTYHLDCDARFIYLGKNSDYTRYKYDSITRHLSGTNYTIYLPSASGTLALASDIPSAVTESTVSGWGFTKNTGTLTGVSFNGTAATVTNGVASIAATIPTDSNLVHITGIEHISGGKAFGADVNLEGNNNILAHTVRSGFAWIEDADGHNIQEILDEKYEKPSGGIPSSDLTTTVQTSLGKADTALQSFTETDPTVPSWAKQSTKPTYTASEVGALPDTTVIPTVPTNVSAFNNDANYVKYVLCADEAAYNAISNKDSGTLYLIPKTS